MYRMLSLWDTQPKPPLQEVIYNIGYLAAHWVSDRQFPSNPGLGTYKKLYFKMALRGTVKPGFLLCLPLCQCLAVELPKISEPTHHWPVSSYSQAAQDRRVCVLQPHLRYESGEQGEAQGAGHERDTATAEESPLWKRAGHHAVSQSCSLCQAEPSSTCWGTSSYSRRCGLPSSCPRTDRAWTTGTWHGLGLTAALELPQEHTAFQSHNLSIPAPCPTRLPWVWEKERSHSSSSLHPPHTHACPYAEGN